jgi:flagellar biosynthesis component FlhA
MPAFAPKSVLSRLLSLEGLLLVVGLALLLFGVVDGSLIAFFWGAIAVAGQVALHFVRKKDWQAHWAEMEREQRPSQKSDEKIEP